MALALATARSFEQNTGRAPHKLSDSTVRPKPIKLVPSFHGVAAHLAIDSGVGPRTGSDLPVDSACTVIIAENKCPGHALGTRVCEQMVMWRSRSRKG